MQSGVFVMFLGNISRPKGIVVGKRKRPVTEDSVIGIAPAKDLQLKMVGGVILRIGFEIFRKNEAREAAVCLVNGHVQLLLEGLHERGQGRTLVKPGAAEFQTGKASTVHKARTADGAQIIEKAQRLHGAKIHEGITADMLKKARERQIGNIPIVPVIGFLTAKHTHFVARNGSPSCSKRMVQQRSNRQPEQLIRQDGILITGQGPKNCDSVIFPAYGKLPVCETADRFQGFLLLCDVPPENEGIFDIILYNNITPSVFMLSMKKRESMIIMEGLHSQQRERGRKKQRGKEYG